MCTHLHVSVFVYGFVGVYVKVCVMYMYIYRFVCVYVKLCVMYMCIYCARRQITNNRNNKNDSEDIKGDELKLGQNKTQCKGLMS